MEYTYYKKIIEDSLNKIEFLRKKYINLQYGDDLMFDWCVVKLQFPRGFGHTTFARRLIEDYPLSVLCHGTRAGMPNIKVDNTEFLTMATLRGYGDLIILDDVSVSFEELNRLYSKLKPRMVLLLGAAEYR
jgi:hypothetical protein